MSQRILTPKQVAEKLGKNEETIWRWLRKGCIPGRRVGGSWLIPEEDLDHFFATGTMDSRKADSDAAVR